MRDNQIIKTERKTIVTRAGGREGEGEALFDVYGVSTWNDETLLETGSGDGCTTLCIDLMSL